MITHYLKVTNISLRKLMVDSSGKIPYASFGMDIDTVIRDNKQGYIGDIDTHVSVIPIDDYDLCVAALPKLKAVVESTPYPGDAVEIITNAEAESLKPSIVKEADL